MSHKLRRRTGEEAGFTLIELLVVILIIGILAAIAIPTFLNQKDKATDASAKELVHSAETAAETYATDRSGKYTGMTASALAAIEPTIQVGPANNNAYIDTGGVTVTGGGTGYSVTATSPSGNTYTVTRNSDGTTSRSCTTVSSSAAVSGGCVGGSW